jgi:ribonuclease Z
MRLTLLGTGTPAPTLGRQSSGYVVEVGSDVLLLDHGPGAFHRLLESGRRVTDVTHVLFSHLHYDPCLDYPRLVLQRWDQGAGRIPELEVYGPPPIARMTTLLFGEDGVYDADLAARVGHESSLDVFRARGGTLPRLRPAPRVTEVHAGSVIEGRGWTITVGSAQHVQPYLECLAFRIDADGRSLCYGGDSSPTDALAELAGGCDVLIQMNHFFSGQEPSAAFAAACGHHRGNAELARRAGVGTLVLTHIPPELDTADARDRILTEAGEIFGGAVVWGEDLMELAIGH